KLASTSRGLLIISLLLTPLNLLLLATPGTGAGGGWVDVAVKVAAVLTFVWIVRVTRRRLLGTDLLPGPGERRWVLAPGVCGGPAVGDGGLLAAGVPLFCHVLACGAALAGLPWYRRREVRESLTDRQGTALLTFVGLSLFAVVASWGLSVTRSADVPATLVGL